MAREVINLLWHYDCGLIPGKKIFKFFWLIEKDIEILHY